MIFGGLSASALAASPEAASMTRSRPFTDVRFGNWFFPAVEFVHQHGVMTGTDTAVFSPNANFSRAMVVTTLFRMYHNRPANASDPRNTPFADVPTGAWFAPYVAWGHQNGIVTGYAGNFMPTNNVQRQELATMLHRFASSMTNRDTSVRQGSQWWNFTDRNQIQHWAVNALTWANYHGLITGRTDTTIAPTGFATRAEAAAILARFMGANLTRPRINVAELLDRPFSQVNFDFGDVISTFSDTWAWTIFDSGIIIGLDPGGQIMSIQVNYFHDVAPMMFYYNEIDHRSTRQNVRWILGEPDFSDGISYTYWFGEVLNGTVLNFTFNSHDQDRVDSIHFAHIFAE